MLSAEHCRKMSETELQIWIWLLDKYFVTLSGMGQFKSTDFEKGSGSPLFEPSFKSNLFSALLLVLREQVSTMLLAPPSQGSLGYNEVTWQAFAVAKILMQRFGFVHYSEFSFCMVCCWPLWLLDGYDWNWLNFFFRMPQQDFGKILFRITPPISFSPWSSYLVFQI